PAPPRAYPGCVFRTRRLLCVHEPELSDHSFLDVVRGRVHVHGPHVHSPYDTSSMVKRSLTTAAQRHGIALCLCCIAFVASLGFAIEKEPLQEYRGRRERLAERIKGNVLVLRAAPDQELVKYRQEPNFYYLTGFDEPNAILLLDTASDPPQEFLFLPERKRSEERWTGPKLGPGSEAEKRTGISKVLSTTEFDSTLKKSDEKAKAVYTLKDVENEIDYVRQVK